VIQASLLKELLKVLRGWPHLELATARDLHGMLHARAAYLLVDGTIIVGHCRSLSPAPPGLQPRDARRGLHSMP
jgi:hypothetical protein